jgi:transcriptional regulator with XRE-family HTH domain
MNSESEQFGLNLRLKIKQRRMTYQKAADKIDTSLSHLNNMMIGNSAPSFEMLVRICRSLQIDPSELIGSPKYSPQIEKLIRVTINMPPQTCEILINVAEALSVPNKTADSDQN